MKNIGLSTKIFHNIKKTFSKSIFHVAQWTCVRTNFDCVDNFQLQKYENINFFNESIQNKLC